MTDTTDNLKEENSRLRKALEELVILNDLARNIGSLQDSQEVTHAIIRKSVSAVHAEQGTITLIDRTAVDSMKTFVRTMEGGEQTPFHFHQALLGWMELNRKPMILNTPGDDERFKGTKWDANIRSILCVPLMIKTDLIGMLSVYNCKQKDGFTQENQRLLAIIGMYSSQVVESSRLYDEERRLKEELRKYTDELEHRVAERTQELEHRNRELAETIRHLQETQLQLIHSEKMASLGQLSAGIAHEISNPLNFVNNFSELSTEMLVELEEMLHEAAEARSIVQELLSNVGKIHEHGRRADSIVKGMMLHARGGKGERRTVDINALLDEAVNITYHGMLAQDESFEVNIVRVYDPDVPEIEIVPQEINRAFSNILSNALYAASHRECPAADNGRRPSVEVRTARRDSRVTVRIHDNGAGIPDAIRGNIFEPFFTTKPTGTGTGLGLSVTYDIIVQQHGGEIAFESSEAGGTDCIISLPL